MSCNLKAVTLNVWGIRNYSKELSIRYSELIKALKQSDYDIVALQEVWSQADFDRLSIGLRDKYPYSNYFHSGLIGSGCCIFSKHQIIEVFQARYSVNGLPYKIHHGDWFGGKSVGLAKIKYFGLNLCVYVTHLHANYAAEETSDEYLAHRISQAFELSQFISITSTSADFVLLMGDLNLMPHELGFKILRDNAFLFDSFMEAENRAENTSASGTCFAPTNCYVSSKDKRLNPNGIRIDYILYKYSNNFQAKCVNYKLCFGRIPGRLINYSDHEAVSAEFLIDRIDNTKPYHNSIDEYTNNNEETKIRLKNELIESFDKIDAQIRKVKRQQKFFTFLSILTGLMALILLCIYHRYYAINVIISLFLIIISIFCIWTAFMGKVMERNHLKSIFSSMKFILKSRYQYGTMNYYDEETNLIV